MLIALAAGYLGNCFTGLGFAPGTGPGSNPAIPGPAPAARTEGEATARPRVSVQGER